MTQTFTILLPQTMLAACACLLILGSAFSVRPRRWGGLALAAVAASALCLAYVSSFSADDWAPDAASSVLVDSISIGYQWMCLGLAALFVLLSHEQAATKTSAEFYALLLFMFSGMMLVGSANELILIFLSLELISVPTYVLLYLGRRDPRSQEAALKYFLLSVLSAAVLLYGFSLLYGLAGTTNLDVIRNILAETYSKSDSAQVAAGGSVLGMVALVLIFAGLGFKVAAVPFHFYAPDVYQGTSAYNAGLLAIIPKAAGLVALIRVASETMVGFETSGERVALILAGITMTGGNCLGLLQSNIRRMLAYSSIAYAGYMLIGVAVGFWDSWNGDLSLDAAGGLPGGVGASLLYLFTYSLATVGLFGVLVYLARPGGRQIEHIDDLTGLVRTHPVMATCAALFLFSLAGVPPLPGFWGKLAVFASALSVRGESPGLFVEMHSGFMILAVVGVLNAAVGAVYYLRVVALMFLNDPVSSPQPSGGKPAFAAVCCSAVLLMGVGIFPTPLFTYLNRGVSQIAPATVRSPAGTLEPRPAAIHGHSVIAVQTQHDR